MTVKIITAGPGVRATSSTGVAIVTDGPGPPGRPGSTVADIPIFVSAQMADNELLGAIWISTKITLAPARCRAVAGVAPTANASVRFTLDGADLFAIPWTAGQAAGSLAGLPAVINPGLLRIFAPVVADATFGDLSILLSGDRS